MTIGQRIKNRRIELGLTVDQLAERLDKNRATIYRYENSFIEKLPTTVLEPLAVALKTTPAYFMGWEEAPEEIPEQKSNQIIAITRDGEKIQYDLSESEMQAVITILDRMRKE